MKSVKQFLTLLITVLFTFQFTNAQDSPPSMFVVHTDHVNYDKFMDYEKEAKAMKDNLVKHDIQDMTYTAVSVEDGRYVYVSPIKSMADLDKNPMSTLMEKMGKEEGGKMLDRMDQCYDKHHNAVIHHIPELKRYAMLWKKLKHFIKLKTLKTAMTCIIVDLEAMRTTLWFQLQVKMP